MPTTTNTLLIVDDTPEQIDILHEFLTAHAFEILVAKDGTSALKIAQDQLPDLILLDVLMPNMDGFETCQRLKADERTQHIPVIFMSALSSTSEKIEGFRSGAIDYVTKPFQKEEVLAHIHTHLTLHNLQKKLELQNQQLKILDVEKNQFLTLASQDLKNTLATILGVAQFLAKNQDITEKEQLAEFLNMIELSSEQMLQLICNILDVNKIESKCLTYSLEKVDVLPLLYLLIEHYAEIARIKHIELVTNMRMDREIAPIYVVADRRLLQQIFDNLLSNAIKFTPHRKTVAIDIEYTATTVSCAIQDNGPGILPSDQQKLFTKFCRLDSKPTGDEHCAGLGLFITKRLIDTLDGKICCESNELGAKFTVEFTRAI